MSSEQYSLEEKDLGASGDEKPNVSCQCVPVAQKAAWTASKVATGMREVILPLYFALVKPHLKY